MNHSIPNSSALKVCLKCGESKPVSEFSKNRNRKDGLQAYCKACQSAHRHARYWGDAEYREKQREQWRAYRSRPEIQQKKVEWDKSRGYQTDTVRARVAVGTAVRRGKLPPVSTMVCVVCDEAQAEQWHHHNGYEKEHWLDVVPVCRECHGKEHWGGTNDK